MNRNVSIVMGLVLLGLGAIPAIAAAADKPNILFIVSDDTGYGDLGPYGGGEGRGMPTPNIDRMADEGMTFFSFYAQPSCTPGRAAMQTGRIPNRSGMTTVAFQGQGGGLPAGRMDAGVRAQDGRLQDLLHRQMAPGRSRLCAAECARLRRDGALLPLSLNAYTYGDPTWFPDMDPELREMFDKVTKGSMSGNAGEQPVEETGRLTVNTSTRRDRPKKVSSVFRSWTSMSNKSGSKFLEDAAKNPDQPFFININFMKVHQPNLPAPEFELQIDVEIEVRRFGCRTRYAYRSHHGQAARTRSGQEHARVYTTDNGAWQDVYPDAGYTPFRGTKGTVREGGNRVPAIALWPGKIKGGVRNHDIVGGLDLMATFASVAGVKLPKKDREGQPIIFDSYDMTPLLFGTGKCDREAMVLLHRKRTVAGCGARWQLQGRVQSCAATMVSRPVASRSTPILAGKARRNTSPRCRRFSISGRIRRNVTTSS